MTSRTWVTGPTGNTPITAASLNGIEHDLDIRAQLWQPNTAYVTGQPVVNPSGDLVTAKTNHTSGGTYTAGNWNLSGSYATTASKGAVNGIAGLDSSGLVPVTQLPSSSTDYGYAWLGFTGNGVCFESLNVASSSDGKSFTLGASSPVYTPVSTGTSLRDPSMMKIGSTYFVAYTANNGLNKNFEIASSTDLLHWTLVATVDCSTVPSAYQTWAPELIQDTNGDIYAFFTNVTNGGPVPSIWRVKAIDTTGLTTWGAPVAMSWTTLPNWPIDATFQYTNGQWYCFYANNNTMFVERATSPTLTGTFTVDKTGDWAGWGYGREAPQLVQVSSTKWRIYIDRFSGTSPNWVYAGYAYSESSDLTTWTALTTVATDPGFPIGQLMRHGAFLKIPDATTRNTVAAAVAGRKPLRHAEYTGAFTTVANTATGPGALTMDTGTAYRAGDFISSTGTSQVTVGVAGNYNIDFLATFNNGACGGGYIAIKNPAATAVYATQDLVASAQAWNIGNSNLYLPAGSVLQFFVQTTNARTGCTARIRITKTD